ncbi:hypothetical protein KJ762_00950 [bacterium]|nr:hypothetical protein [bacterium]MBU1063264.1 hypothetical protein [bacterium]MBU1633057.1 hypothetical protein [bacterium]MBU1873983.1 hypothetical protein [bacterium]
MNRWIGIVLIGLFILGTAAQAQDDFMEPMDPDRREQMEALRIWKMTEYLELSTEQSILFFPRLKEFEDIIHDNQNRQRDIMKSIYELLKDENYTTTEKDVKNYAKQLAGLEKEISNQKEAFITSIGDVLTKDQQLKFIVFDNRFRNRLMRSIYQPQGHGKGPKRERK